jgi:transposase
LSKNKFEAEIQEALNLHRKDPAEWTYAKLAEWLSEKTGKRYMTPRVAQVLEKRDPSLRKPRYLGQVGL